MITETEKRSILNAAERYSFSHLYLFGSAYRNESGYRDIDLAVEGLAPSDFFSFYGDLICAVSLPVDLIDLSEQNPFCDIVRKESVVLI